MAHIRPHIPIFLWILSPLPSVLNSGADKSDDIDTSDYKQAQAYSDCYFYFRQAMQIYDFKIYNFSVGIKN